MKGYRKIIPLLGMVLLSSCRQAGPKEENPLHFIASPAHKESSLPHLFKGSENLMMSWVETLGDTLSILKYSSLIQDEWTKPEEIVRGDDWFVNWADYPMLIENKGHLLSHILKKTSEATFSYDVRLNVRSKGVPNWQTDVSLHTDGTKTEHGFVSMLPYEIDSFFVTWLDGRETQPLGHGHGAGAMTLRTATISSSGVVRDEELLDNRTCDCCQTTAAMTTNGPVVFYRDRSDQEIRDISMVRKVNDAWTEPQTIHEDGWKIKGCPVNGPKSDAKGNNVVVTWFTAANDQPKVKLVFSGDGGANFDAPITISEGEAIGRVDVSLEEDTAIVSWMEMTDDKAQLKAIKVNRAGEKSVPISISKLDPSRKTGFPQIEVLGTKAYFAWTEISAGVTTIKTAFVLLTAF